MILIEYLKESEEQIAEYREQLGVSIRELQDMPLPSGEELDKLTNHLEVLQAERNKSAEIFFNTQLEIKDIMEKMQIKPRNKYEQLVDLQEEYECTNNRVSELRERLTKLCDCLEMDQDYRETFLHAHPGCHKDTEMSKKKSRNVVKLKNRICRYS
ncbi:hypothetical protein ACJJTC_001047 [Scirpophaga incertulas]